jgi:hypothetical protein
VPWLPVSAALAEQSYDFHSCAVVGNSGILLKSKFGTNIDSHTAVIRANQAPVHRYALMVGRKTTFRLLNKLWVEKYGGRDGDGDRPASRGANNLLAHGSGRRIDPGVLPLEPNLTLLASRADDQLISKLHLKYDNGTHKRKDVRVQSLYNGITGSCKLLMDDYRASTAKCTGQSATGPTTPSSGLVAVYMMMYLCRHVSVYGFGVEPE